MRRLVFSSPMDRDYIYISISCILFQTYTIPREKSPWRNGKIKSLPSNFDPTDICLIHVIMLEICSISYIADIIQSIILYLLDRFQMGLRSAIHAVIVCKIDESKSYRLESRENTTLRTKIYGLMGRLTEIWIRDSWSF